MTFEETLTQTCEMLRRHGRVSLRALKRQFGIDDAYVADLRAELVEVRRLASEEDGGVLVWKEARGAADTRAAPARRPHESERRHLVVMFCDLVDATSLSERLDPEQLGEVYSAWQDACVEIIERFEGHVAEYRGDGVFVYFGYPVAFEDAAQRAILAALDIIAQLDVLNPRLLASHGVTLAVRIGIHSGLVLLSDLGGRFVRDQFAVGEAPNVAARIQALAGANAIAVSEPARALARNQFEFADLGAQTLKGLSRPMRAYLVRAALHARSRGGADAPFVARAAELALLQDRWRLALQAESRVVMVSGEAGIGKSRLVAALRGVAERDGARRITLYCTSHRNASALYPVIEHLHRFLRFERDDAEATKLDKLQGALAAAGFDAATYVPLLAPLLSLPVPPSFAPLGLNPQQQRVRTIEALVRWLVQEANAAPLLLVVEDLHWADASSLELLQLLIDEMAGVRLLLLTTARPEFRAPWPNRSHVSQIMLGRLSDTESEAFALSRGRNIPHETLATVLARADGIPLFIEELLAAVADSRGAPAPGAQAETASQPIPHTLQGSLMARLDRLPEARDVAQLGAALGRQFTRDMIEALEPGDAAAIEASLAQLVDHELLQRRATADGVVYRFRHSLIRDAAHGSMLKSRRSQIHRRIAQLLEQRFAATAQGEPEVLAHHWAEGGELQRAVDCWQRAGEQARARCANIEALSHLDRACDALKTLPPGADNAQRELKLEVARGAVLLMVHGQSAPVVEQAYRRAGELSLRMGDSADLHPVLLGLWRYHIGRADMEAAHGIAEKLFGLARRIGDTSILIDGYMTLGVTLYHLWEMPRALELIEESIRLFETPLGADAADRVAIGQHSGLGSVLCTAYIHLLAGRPAKSAAALERAQRIAHGLASPFQLCNALGWGALLCQIAGDVDGLRRYAVPALKLAEEHNFPIWVTAGKGSVGALRVLDGAHGEGLAMIDESLKMVERVGYAMFRTRGYLTLAEACRVAGRIGEGLEAAETALSVVARGSERWWEPEIHRVQGALLLAGQPARRAQAEAAFRRALALARERGLPSFELRAALALARLVPGARGELAQACARFTDGFETRDLVQARELLRAPAPTTTTTAS